ncbi:hypothetical protein M1146_05130, partial [Patescibacteria group bacterium]|nr:hypothetical protein [Patescibacteria group bacterium]
MKKIISQLLEHGAEMGERYQKWLEEQQSNINTAIEISVSSPSKTRTNAYSEMQPFEENFETKLKKLYLLTLVAGAICYFD